MQILPSVSTREDLILLLLEIELDIKEKEKFYDLLNTFRPTHNKIESIEYGNFSIIFVVRLTSEELLVAKLALSNNTLIKVLHLDVILLDV